MPRLFSDFLFFESHKNTISIHASLEVDFLNFLELCEDLIVLFLFLVLVEVVQEPVHLRLEICSDPGLSFLLVHVGLLAFILGWCF